MVKPAIESAGGTVISDSPERTREIAARLGERCGGGETILLFGDLGSGKTCFVQGLALGLGIPPEMRITSPTFTLHGEYQGRLILNHLDLYRLEERKAMEGLGIEDMLSDREAVTAVEWPELLADMVTGDRLEIRLSDLGEGQRALSFTAFGPASARLLQDMREQER